MNSALGPGAEAWLKARGGLRARILTDGVLAVDLPRMNPEFLRRLVARCEPLTGVIPKLRGQIEPLAAIYPKRCRYLAQDCLRKCRLAARDFAEACLHEHAARTFSFPQRFVSCFDNCNWPSDLAAVRWSQFSTG